MRHVLRNKAPSRAYKVPLGTLYPVARRGNRCQRTKAVLILPLGTVRLGLWLYGIWLSDCRTPVRPAGPSTSGGWCTFTFAHGSHRTEVRGVAPPPNPLGPLAKSPRTHLSSPAPAVLADRAILALWLPITTVACCSSAKYFSSRDPPPSRAAFHHVPVLSSAWKTCWLAVSQPSSYLIGLALTRQACCSSRASLQVPSRRSPRPTLVSSRPITTDRLFPL